MNGSTRTPRRFALLRDIDSPNYAPLAVLFEVEGGHAQMVFFETAPPTVSRLKRLYPDYDKALETWSRSAIVSALGKEKQQ